MAKKPTSKEEPRKCDEEPKWLNGPIRTTPYTEEELAMFAEGFKEGLSDTAKWQELVNQVGEEKAEIPAFLVTITPIVLICPQKRQPSAGSSPSPRLQNPRPTHCQRSECVDRRDVHSGRSTGSFSIRAFQFFRYLPRFDKEDASHRRVHSLRKEYICYQPSMRLACESLQPFRIQAAPGPLHRQPAQSSGTLDQYAVVPTIDHPVIGLC